MINPVILIIPDIHGRDFYQNALKEAVDKNIEVICLGDYLDPYFGDEIHEDGPFAPLQELMEMKKKKPERFRLLIGNHDSSYLYRAEMCRSRFDWNNAQKYHDFFIANALHFDLFHDIIIANKRFLFSHAGVSARWLAEIGYATLNEALNALDNSYLDYCLNHRVTDIWNKLAHVGENRGGHHKNGSMIWADFFEHTESQNWLKENDVIQIVGHTQLSYNPIRVSGRLFCLDCREPFYIDSDGIIMSWHTDKSIMETDNFTSKK